jgi:hypothetical protein
MKKLLSILALALCVSAIPAHATPITISLSNPNQTGNIGQTLQFFGVITNNSGAIVNLNTDDLILNVPGVTLTDLFNDNVPFSLDASGPGASSGLIELFDITLTAGFTGFNLGTYDLTDGVSTTPLGSTNFSVAPTPEPSSILLLLTGLSTTAIPTLRRRLSPHRNT